MEAQNYLNGPLGDSYSGEVSPARENTRAFDLFRKVQEAMQHVPNIGETCKAILDATVDTLDVENCSLMLIDPVSGELSVRAARGKNEGKSVYYPDLSGNGKRFFDSEFLIQIFSHSEA